MYKAVFNTLASLPYTIYILKKFIPIYTLERTLKSLFEEVGREKKYINSTSSVFGLSDQSSFKQHELFLYFAVLFRSRSIPSIFRQSTYSSPRGVRSALLFFMSNRVLYIWRNYKTEQTNKKKQEMNNKENKKN